MDSGAVLHGAHRGMGCEILRPATPHCRPVAYRLARRGLAADRSCKVRLQDAAVWPVHPIGMPRRTRSPYGDLVMNLAGQPSFRLIAPFLGPVMGLLEDESVTEVMINPDSVFVERSGRLETVHGLRLPPLQVRRAALAIARSLGDDIGEDRPLLDGRLPDGSRVAAALPPCSFGGPALTIRKFARRRLTLDDLARSGSLPGTLPARIRQAVEQRRTILVSGGTGTGKTTLLAAIADLIPTSQRVIVIEDTVELPLAHPNMLRLAVRRASGDAAGVTMRDLVRAALRHRPDRIVVGEVRGGEAWDLLQALNTGHDGSLSTLHASSAYNAMKRCASCVLQSRIGLPYETVQDLLGDVIDIVLHLERRDGQRRVVEAIRVEQFDQSARRWQCRPLDAGMPSGHLKARRNPS